MIKDVTAVYGYQQIVGLVASTALTIPTRSNQTGLSGTPTVAVITVENAAVRWRDDKTAPTASVGMPLAVGIPLQYDGNLQDIQFIEQVAGAKLNISYYA